MILGKDGSIYRVCACPSNDDVLLINEGSWIGHFFDADTSCQIVRG